VVSAVGQSVRHTVLVLLIMETRLCTRAKLICLIAAITYVAAVSLVVDKQMGSYPFFSIYCVLARLHETLFLYKKIKNELIDV
jgi:hypothetical protein